jgi:hypothetical protein
VFKKKLQYRFGHSREVFYSAPFLTAGILLYLTQTLVGKFAES